MLKRFWSDVYEIVIPAFSAGQRGHPRAIIHLIQSCPQWTIIPLLVILTVDTPFVTALLERKPFVPICFGFTCTGSAFAAATLAVFASSRDMLFGARNGFSPADKTR